MPDPTLNGNLSRGGGFYGKLPALGDFVSRRLPRTFLDPWEVWLEDCLVSSRERLGDAWLNHYLTSPLWRFALSRGICGETPWAGVIMPSVDRVGRYYPLTVAVPLVGNANPCLMPEVAGEWFTRLEEIALSALSPDFDLDRFDRELITVPVPNEQVLEVASAAHSSHNAWRVGLGDGDDPARVWPTLVPRLLEKFVFSYSIWWSRGSDRVSPSLLGCQGLPHARGYAALLDGTWDSVGWEQIVSRPSVPR